MGQWANGPMGQWANGLILRGKAIARGGFGLSKDIPQFDRFLKGGRNRRLQGGIASEDSTRLGRFGGLALRSRCAARLFRARACGACRGAVGLCLLALIF